MTFQGALAASLDACSPSGGRLTVYRSKHSSTSPPTCAGEVFMELSLPTSCEFSMLFNAFIQVRISYVFMALRLTPKRTIRCVSRSPSPASRPPLTPALAIHRSRTQTASQQTRCISLPISPTWPAPSPPSLPSATFLAAARAPLLPLGHSSGPRRASRQPRTGRLRGLPLMTTSAWGRLRSVLWQCRLLAHAHQRQMARVPSESSLLPLISSSAALTRERLIAGAIEQLPASVIGYNGSDLRASVVHMGLRLPTAVVAARSSHRIRT
jgi:hypothetical protein